MTRTNFTQKQKNDLWKQTFGSSLMGHCPKMRGGQLCNNVMYAPKPLWVKAGYKRIREELERENNGIYTGECDHIIADYLGGQATRNNAEFICKNCNAGKGAKTLDEEQNMMSISREYVDMMDIC